MCHFNDTISQTGTAARFGPSGSNHLNFRSHTFIALACANGHFTVLTGAHLGHTRKTNLAEHLDEGAVPLRSSLSNRAPFLWLGALLISQEAFLLFEGRGVRASGLVLRYFRKLRATRAFRVLGKLDGRRGS